VNPSRRGFSSCVGELLQELECFFTVRKLLLPEHEVEGRNRQQVMRPRGRSSRSSSMTAVGTTALSQSLEQSFVPFRLDRATGTCRPEMHALARRPYRVVPNRPATAQIEHDGRAGRRLHDRAREQPGGKVVENPLNREGGARAISPAPHTQPRRRGDRDSSRCGCGPGATSSRAVQRMRRTPRRPARPGPHRARASSAATSARETWSGDSSGSPCSTSARRAARQSWTMVKECSRTVLGFDDPRRYHLVPHRSWFYLASPSVLESLIDRFYRSRTLAKGSCACVRDRTGPRGWTALAQSIGPAARQEISDATAESFVR